MADPYPALARLRDEAPISYDDRTNQWLVSRHADVNALLRDRRLGRSYLRVASHEAWGRPPPPEDQAPFWDLLAVQMIDMEPPDHTRLRRLVSTAFTPRTVEALRPRIEAIVDGAIDDAQALGEFDLIADLLEGVPVAVIAELLGIPDDGPAPAPTVVGRHDPHVRAQPDARRPAPRHRGERRVRGLPARHRPGATADTRA